MKCLCLNLSGAFLLFSQKKLAKLNQTEQNTALDVCGRNAAVQQVYTDNNQHISMKKDSSGLLAHSIPQV